MSDLSIEFYSTEKSYTFPFRDTSLKLSSTKSVRYTGWSKKSESKIEFMIIGIQKKITFHAFVFELSNHFPKILQSLGAKEENKKKI